MAIDYYKKGGFIGNGGGFIGDILVWRKQCLKGQKFV